MTLREKAEAATPGPWQESRFVDKRQYAHMGADWHLARAEEEARVVRGPGVVGSPECNQIAVAQYAEDRAYIAAADPQTIIALLDVVEAAKEVQFQPTAVWDAMSQTDREKVQRMYRALDALPEDVL